MLSLSLYLCTVFVSTENAIDLKVLSSLFRLL